MPASRPQEAYTPQAKARRRTWGGPSSTLGSADRIGTSAGLVKVEKIRLAEALEKTLGEHFLRSQLLGKKTKDIDREDVHIFALAAARTLYTLGKDEATKTLIDTENDLTGRPGHVLSEEYDRDELVKEFIFDGDWSSLWPDDELLSTSEAAKLLSISQQAVNNAIKQNRIIGLKRDGRRSLRVPKRQFSAKLDRIEKLDLLIDEIGSHNLTWLFLTSEFRFNSKITPLEKYLNDNDFLEILTAARSFSLDFL